jgi:glycolate oxidase FAD binding subunit
MSAIAHTLEQIVGSDSILTWEQLEPQVQNQILPAIGELAPIECLVYPRTSDELAEVMHCAAQSQWRVLPTGGTSKLKWGGIADKTQIVVSTARLNRLVEHAVGDLTVTAEAGIRFAELQATLARAGQFLAIDPVCPAIATLGGIVATADTGALRQRYGGIRDMLIGLSFVRSDGQITKAGGRVVKNVAGYDLMKLLTGSYGTLGIISQVTFRIYPLPTASRTVILTGTAEALAQLLKTVMASALMPTAIDLLSPRTSTDLGMINEMALLLRFQSIDVSVEKQAQGVLEQSQLMGVKGISIADGEQSHLWQKLAALFEPADQDVITCKIGVPPSLAVVALDKFHALVPTGCGRIHAGVGIGMLRLCSHEADLPTLLRLREWYQSQGGFLTVLEAPLSLKQQALKQQVDLWGYGGDALQVMQTLKHQFDPGQLLSPHRFVGGI